MTQDANAFASVRPLEANPGRQYHSGKPRATRAACIALSAAGALLAIVAIAALFAGMSMRGAAAEHVRGPDGNGTAGGEAAIDWEYWQSVNPDVVAWLEIPGTGIDAPVVQARADDPGFYLDHDVYGNWNLWGCVYVDAACEKGIDDRNVVILGHNMGDGTMLGPLERYRDEAFARTHAEGFLHTPGGTRPLGIVGSETIDGSSPVKRTAFASSIEFATYRSSTLQRCSVRIDQAGPGRAAGRLYTFCTCSYFVNPDNERTLVYAQ